MNWLKFCELFTLLNLSVLGLATAIAILFGIVYGIYSIIEFVQKIKFYFDDFDILKHKC